jgi:hypothetical protein
LFLVICLILREKLGKSTIILPLPPIVLGGSQHPATIRSIYELMSLTDDYFQNETVYLEVSTQVAREILNEQGAGS